MKEVLQGSAGCRFLTERKVSFDMDISLFVVGQRAVKKADCLCTSLYPFKIHAVFKSIS